MSRPDSRHILERLAFVIYLGLFVGSCGLTGLGLISAVLLGNPQPLIIGCGGSVLTALIRDVGYRQWHFGRWDQSLEKMHGRETAYGGEERQTPEARKLERVLLSLDRASADRDVWKVQRLRAKVRALLKKEPGLQREFAAELTRHPEIG